MWHPRRAATFPRAHIETCRLVAGTHRWILLHLLPASKKFEILGTTLKSNRTIYKPSMLQIVRRKQCASHES